MFGKGMQSTGLLASVVAALSNTPVGPNYYNQLRGPNPFKRRSRKPKEYYKGGTPIKNKKIAANVDMMFQKYLAAKAEHTPVHKQEPDPHSITTVKRRTGLPRHLAREMALDLQRKAAEKAS